MGERTMIKIQKRLEYKRSDKEYIASPQRLQQHVLTDNSSFAVVEAYKAARTNLLFTRTGDGCQRIVFTSTFPHEGKSINCINTAITLAANGQRVLMIDADLRRPVLHSVFNISPDVGLSEILAGLTEQDTSKAMLHTTQHERLFLLPSGKTPPNAAELLSSKRMSSLLKMLGDTFDYVLIDTPPLGMVTDAAVLIPMVQGHVVVVRAGVTPMDKLRDTVLRLEQLQANVMGFILNDLDAKTGSYNYKYHHRYGEYEPANNIKQYAHGSR